MDDVAGLFYDRTAMAILKAATWPSSQGRIISWGSTTSKATVQSFEFRGKLVVISNSIPDSLEAAALKSRSLIHQFQVSPALAKNLPRKAAENQKWFRNTSLAREVAEFLCEILDESNIDEISYRTLHIGYDAAETKPEHWRKLLCSMVQVSAPVRDPESVVFELSRQGMKVNDQIRAFEELTGFKRRTFFNYRKRLVAANKTRR